MVHGRPLTGALGLALVACSAPVNMTQPRNDFSDIEDASVPFDAAPSIDQLCTQLAKNTCDRFASACAPVVMQLLFEGGPTECQTGRKAVCLAVEGAGTADTPMHLAACAQARTTASCDELLVYTAPSISCAALPGPRTSGAGCATDFQCQSAFCKNMGVGTCGTCAVFQPVGGSCTIDGECQRGLHCVNMKCAAYPTSMAGTPCTSDEQCNWPLRCFGVYDGTKFLSGSTCGLMTVSTAGGSCGWMTMNATGGTSFYAYQGCPEGDCHFPNASSYTGTCPTIVDANATCDETHVCRYPALCVSGTCHGLDFNSCH